MHLYTRVGECKILCKCVCECVCVLLYGNNMNDYFNISVHTCEHRTWDISDDNSTLLLLLVHINRLLQCM